MTRLNNLKEIADNQLGGLTADTVLKARILTKARGGEAPVRRNMRKSAWKPAMAVILCAALCVFAGVSALVPGGMLNNSAYPSPTDNLSSRPAGESVTLPESGEGLRALYDLGGNSLTVGEQKEAPSYRSLYAKGSGANFPMIMVDGKTYRMLKSPSNAKSRLCGDELGTVTEYSEEPALSSGGGIVSNIALQGETVYAVKGMKGAMAIANVDGKLRVFQRVSFSGTAVVGSEALSDVLCASGDVSKLELSGVGTVEGGEAARLMKALLDNAEYDGSSADFSAKQSLIIGLNNGLSMQLMVKNDSVSACGTWSCPEFFEEFAAAMGQ